MGQKMMKRDDWQSSSQRQTPFQVRLVKAELQNLGGYSDLIFGAQQTGLQIWGISDCCSAFRIESLLAVQSERIVQRSQTR